MRNFKFLATAIVAMMLACVLAVSSFAAKTPFTDVDDENEALSESVSLLAGLGITKGVSETKFGTMDLVTREQMAAFVYRLMKNGRTNEGGSNTTAFTDLTDSTYFGYVSWANGLGIIKGTSPTTFNPKGGIILQDAYTMLIRALGHEKEDYIYPYTYIDKAEEIGLDEGLDSVVNYNTKLTRGDVAVLLRNSFFAESGKEKVKQVERLLGDPTNGTWVLEKKKYNVSIAEDIYDIEVGNFEVRATPKYSFNNTVSSTDFSPLCDNYDVDMLQLVAVDSNEPLAEIFCEFSDTGLSGSADDYIMRGVEVFYTYVTKNNVKNLDKIYFVTSDHSIIETNTATFYKEKGKNDGEFYKYTRGAKADQISNVEKLKGYLTVNNKDIYFFDAPYSYAEPTLTPDMSASYRDMLINSKNVKLINVRCLDPVKGTYSYYVDDTKPVNKPDDLHKNLLRVFTRGVYKLKFYDVEGDGIYEYCHYMPATYGFMDGDTNKYFSSVMTKNAPIRKTQRGSSLDLSFKPTIYYNGADIKGVEFNDGDMVLAYLNPAANMIEVMATVKPYKGFVSQIMYNHAIAKIDNNNFQVAYTYRILEDFYDGSDNLYNQFNLNTGDHDFFTLPDFSAGSNAFPKVISRDNTAVGEVFNMYAYKINGWTPCLIWYDHVEDAAISFGFDELAIPVSDENHPAQTYTEKTFHPELAKDVQYAKTYFNGKVSYIPLNVEELNPKLDSGYVSSSGIYNLANVKKNGVTTYLDQVCKVVVDSDGLYTLLPLFFAEDDEGYIGVNKTDVSVLKEDSGSKQFGEALDGTSGYIVKVAGSRYQLLDEFKNSTLLGVNAGSPIDYFNITGATRIIIKNKISQSKNEYEFLEFDHTNFKSSVATELTNIQYILRNDPESTSREDLLLLYAETAEFKFETKSIENSMRIVAGSDISKDDDGDFRNFYKLLNPYTGEVEEKVPGDNYDEKAARLVSHTKAVGTVIEIKDGMVDEDGTAIGSIDTSLNKGLVYLTDYDEEESYIGFVPVEAVKNAISNTTICCGEHFDDFISQYVYTRNELNFDNRPFKLTVNAGGSAVDGKPLYYEVTEDTVVTVLTSDKAGSAAIEKGEFKLADLAGVVNGNNEYKCYNNRVLDINGNYSTAYADYVKAYIYSSRDAKMEDTLPVAEFIIVVVNGDEDTIFADHNPGVFPPATHP